MTTRFRIGYPYAVKNRETYRDTCVFLLPSDGARYISVFDDAANRYALLEEDRGPVILNDWNRGVKGVLLETQDHRQRITRDGHIFGLGTSMQLALVLAACAVYDVEEKDIARLPLLLFSAEVERPKGASPFVDATIQLYEPNRDLVLPSLKSKYETACALGAVALVLHWRDAHLLADEIKQKCHEVSLLAELSEAQSQSSVPIIAAKSNSIPDLAQFLGISRYHYEVPTAQRHRCPWKIAWLAAGVLITLSLLVLWISQYSAGPKFVLVNTATRHQFPARADALCAGYFFAYAWETDAASPAFAQSETGNKKQKPEDYRQQLAKSLGNLRLYPYPDREKNADNLHKAYNDEVRATFYLGYYLAKNAIFSAEGKQGEAKEAQESAHLHAGASGLPAEYVADFFAQRKCRSPSDELETLDMHRNGIALIRSDNFVGLFTSKVIAAGGGRHFYVGGIGIPSGENYSAGLEQGFLGKLDDEGNLLWLESCPAPVKKTCAAAGQDGTAYLAALTLKLAARQGKCKLVVYAKTDTEKELTPGEEFSDDASELSLYDAVVEGDRMWLVGSRNCMQDERFAVWYCDLATQKIAALPTGEISWRSAATAICPDGQGGFYLAGFAEQSRSRPGLLVACLDRHGQMGKPCFHEADCDRIPMAIMRHGPFLYLCGAKEIAAGAYAATLWKYTAKDLSRSPVEIDLPHIRYLQVDCKEDVMALSFSMALWDDHVIVGYHDSSGALQCAMAMVSPADRVVWHQFDGYPNYHEHVVGFYASERRKRVLAISQTNRRWADDPFIGVTAWDIKPR